MIRRKRIVVQIAVNHGRAQSFRQRYALLYAVSHDHAATRKDYRKLGASQQLRRRIEALFATGAELHRAWLRNLDVYLAIEKIPRNIQLCRTTFGHRQVEAAGGYFRYALGAVDVSLKLGDLGEDRQLVRFLETAQADGSRASLWGNGYHWAVRPISGSDRGDKIGDTGTVLAYAHAVFTANARVAVSHMCGTLLVHHGNETYARRWEKIERIHIGGADNSENVLDTLGCQSLDKRLT